MNFTPKQKFNTLTSTWFLSGYLNCQNLFFYKYVSLLYFNYVINCFYLFIVLIKKKPFLIGSRH